MSNLIKCKEYYCPIWSDEKNIVEPDQVTDCKEYCCPIARNIVVQPDERGDLLLAAHHGQESRLFHQQVLRRRPRDLAQVPAVQNCDTRSCSVLQNSSRLLQNCFKTVTPGRLLFCSLLKTERGVALVHLWQGQVLGTQWRRGSQIAGLQDASDSHEVVLGSWQAVRERRILRYTASTKRKISLPKTKKYVAIC